jgi:hypothetical protein
MQLHENNLKRKYNNIRSEKKGKKRRIVLKDLEFLKILQRKKGKFSKK